MPLACVTAVQLAVQARQSVAFITSSAAACAAAATNASSTSAVDVAMLLPSSS